MKVLSKLWLMWRQHILLQLKRKASFKIFSKI
jgi:hypothetical protein